MSTLKNAGPDPVNSEDVAHYDYVTGLKSQDISSSAVDSQINSGYSGYADKSYVDSQDTLNANKAYIDNGDAGRLKLNTKDLANGVAGLAANGKVLPAKINLSNNQRWPRAFWSPTAYNAANVDTNGEATIYSTVVTDPGYAYRIVCFAQIDAATGTTGEPPVAYVRAGNETTGAIIAQGGGMAASYQTSTGLIGGDDFERTALDLGPDWATTYDNAGGTWNIDGHQTVWNASGNSTNNMLARRIQPLDTNTQTDDQRLTLVIGDTAATGNIPFATDGENSVIMRRSADGSSYVRGSVSPSGVRFYYVVNGNESSLGGSTSSSTAGNPNAVLEFSAIDRTFSISLNGTQIHQVVDTTNVTAKGAGNRGWGMGARAGNISTGGQNKPARIASIIIEDAAREFASKAISVVPFAIDSQAVKTGPTTLYVRLTRAGNTAVVRATPYLPSFWAMAVPA